VAKSETEILILQAAIRQMHKCEAFHHKTVFLVERFQGNVIWQGDIEVFDLTGHPQATRCFAWLHQEEGGGERSVVLLDKWPVNSPQMAVKFAIALGFPTHHSPEAGARAD
jgi:hypothetical protein